MTTYTREELRELANTAHHVALGNEDDPDTWNKYAAIADILSQLAEAKPLAWRLEPSDCPPETLIEWDTVSAHESLWSCKASPLYKLPIKESND